MNRNKKNGDRVSKSDKSYYSGDLKSGLVWISSGIWNPKAQSFEIRTNGEHFVKKHLKSSQNVR